MRLIMSLVAAALLFVGCEKSDDKAQKAANEQPINVATSASIKVEKKENNQSTNKQNGKNPSSNYKFKTYKGQA